MEIKDWPINSIDQKVLQSGFSQKARENSIRTQMDAGIDKIRKRYDTPIVEFSFDKWLDFDQYQDMEDFYNITLQGGTYSFCFPDPATDIPYLCRFREPPSYTPLGGRYYKVRLSFERISLCP